MTRLRLYIMNLGSIELWHKFQNAGRFPSRRNQQQFFRFLGDFRIMLVQLPERCKYFCTQRVNSNFPVE